jgi:hypothetical protein
MSTTRRRALGALAGLAGASVVGRALAAEGTGPGQEKEVGAVEDLMREHGVLRRALRVYAELANRLTTSDVDPAPLKLSASAGSGDHVSTNLV